jgi:autotransporter-associated beta strand protein
MTDYSVPPSLTATLTLEGNDTLTVVPVGSIVVDGDDAVLWDLGTSGSVPPGLIVHNQGLIQSLSDRAIDTTGSAGGVLAFTLINEGTVTSPDDAIRINDTLTDGTVVISNYGTIDSSTDGQAIDFNNVESAASISITNYAGGLIHSTDADAIRPGANATVRNYGHIQAEGGGDGIDFQDDAGGTVYNYAGGLIEGGKHGVTGDEAVTVFNAAGATIAGNNGSAVNIDNAPGEDNTVHVTNYGTLEGRSAGTDDSDGDAIDTDGLLVLENYGSVKGLGAQGEHDGGPNVSEGIAMGGGVINNHEDGVIYGYGRAIQVDDSSNGGAFSATEIYNEGLIEGAGNGPEGVAPEDAAPLIPIGNEAINLVGDLADTLTNLGEIIGGVMMGDGADTLTNIGVMSALNGSAIDMGAGNDEVNLYTGSSLTGALIGGDGDLDTLNLLMEGGSPFATGTIAQVSEFESLVVGQGSWTVLDTQVYGDEIEIVAGAELVLGTGGAAGALGGEVVTYGNFAINRSDVFFLDNLIEGGGTLEQRGTGITVIAHANAFTGGALITDGALQLSAVGAVGNGAVSFDAVGGETLILDDAVLTGNVFANVVMSLGDDDAVDFSGLAYAAGTTTSYDEATGLVTVTGRDGTYAFTAVNPGEAAFTAMSDGDGGTRIVLKDIGADISGTKQDDVLTGQKTALGRSLSSDADDAINGRRGDDKIDGQDGNDVLKGSKGDDKLFGSNGDDWLHGGTGSNKLSGGAGFDAFVFDSKLGAGKADADGNKTFSFSKIKDFAVGEDQILLDSKVFKALDAGALSESAFAIGKTAKDADVHILFKNGNIRYDADGKGGDDAVRFAKVGKDIDLGADDFFVV